MTASTQMRGKVCLVTGATSGLGHATARALASAGADVIVVGRDQERGERVRSELEQLGGEAKPTLCLCDLSSQRQLKELVGTLGERLGRLDVLVNNAGVDVGRRELTEDGLELTFAVNHLASFVLTLLLTDALRASEAARVITVTSGAHNQGKIDFDDPQGERRFRGQRARITSRSSPMFCSPSSSPAGSRARESLRTASTPAGSGGPASGVPRRLASRRWRWLCGR